MRTLSPELAAGIESGLSDAERAKRALDHRNYAGRAVRALLEGESAIPEIDQSSAEAAPDPSVAQADIFERALQAKAEAKDQAKAEAAALRQKETEAETEAATKKQAAE